MTHARILVVNPNSNTTVTDAIRQAVTPLARAGVEMTFATLADGPLGIETQAHADSIPVPLCADVAGAGEYDAYVIACFSDPGLHALREATGKPVFGIAECGILTAMARAGQYGVIAIRARGIPRHLRGMRQMLVTGRLAGERAIEMSVAESASGDRTFARMLEIGTELRDLDGADIIVLGCAGMARHRQPLEDALEIPVIDPTQAAVAMAIGTVLTAGPSDP